MAVQIKTKLMLVLAASIISMSAQAADIVCTGSAGLVGPSTGDVRLSSVDSTACFVAASVNPQQGGGNTGIATIPASWGTGYVGDGFDKNGASEYNNSSVNTTFTLGAANSDGDVFDGNWSVNSGAGVFDIVVAMHYGGGSTFFFFDNLALSSGTNLGTWSQQGLNNGGKIAGYSNFNIYFAPGTSTNVPLPGSLALLGLGLAGLGLVSRKKK